MTVANTSRRYAPEVRAGAVRLFQEQVRGFPTRWWAMRTIAARVGCTAETLRLWVIKAEHQEGDPHPTAAVAAAVD